MLEVVADAVHRLGRDEWWSTVRIALDDMTAAGARGYQAESQGLDGVSADGLDGG